MATKEEVRSFLSDFHQKMKIWEIRFRDDRGKNTQALNNLEMSPAQRIKIIETLSVIDYSEGPKTDTLNAGAPLWVFGKEIKSRISFHEAEYEMQLAFKE
jgi:hypothetical protein